MVYVLDIHMGLCAKHTDITIFALSQDKGLQSCMLMFFKFRDTWFLIKCNGDCRSTFAGL